jgi:hypothetical protein
MAPAPHTASLPPPWTATFRAAPPPPPSDRNTTTLIQLNLCPRAAPTCSPQRSRARRTTITSYGVEPDRHRRQTTSCTDPAVLSRSGLHARVAPARRKRRCRHRHGAGGAGDGAAAAGDQQPGADPLPAAGGAISDRLGGPVFAAVTEPDS